MMMLTSAGKARELTGRDVLFCVLAFFAVVFAVNAYFIRVALSTHTGVVANEPYRKGLQYNERIAADSRQSGLGWKSEVLLEAKNEVLSFTLSDASGLPVRGLTVTANVGRPVSSGEDVTLKLAETSPGIYSAEAKSLSQGAYIASIEAGDGLSILYRARKRLWLKP
jgi:nitrogen fixation protein FixH